MKVDTLDNSSIYQKNMFDVPNTSNYYNLKYKVLLNLLDMLRLNRYWYLNMLDRSTFR